jgi:hypothetical protein
VTFPRLAAFITASTPVYAIRQASANMPGTLAENSKPAARFLQVAWRILVVYVCAGVACLLPVRTCLAQGVTTAGIHGRVVAADGSSVDGARVRILNTATGYAVHSEVQHGRFLVQGLEMGGPYTVTVSRLGFRSEQREQVVLRLGEMLQIRFVLQPQAITVDTLIVASAGFLRSNAQGSSGITIADSLIQRMPTLDRDVFDFVALAPQISTKIGFQRRGVSAAGANLRFNSFLIDGVDERSVNGNVSAAHLIGKSIPLPAVREYQVLIAPYDVRYGDFAGALINTVTMSGTNQLHGSGFANWRNDQLTRIEDATDRAPYDRLQYGFALGGPIIRDRVHFFLAPEFQRLTSPARGPFVGQPSSAVPAVPVEPADIARLDRIMRDWYGLRAGSAGPVELSSPLRNVFARLDGAAPRWRSRAFVTFSYAAAANPVFGRTALGDTFSLSSYRYSAETGLRMASLRVHTDLPRTAGGHNELIISHSSDWADFQPDVRQPLVRVLVSGPGGNPVLVNVGTAEQAQGRFGRGSSLKVRNDLSLTLGSQHVLRLGAQAERFRTTRGGVASGYGVWTFPSLDALERGVAGTYLLRKSLSGASTTLAAWQHAAWVGDEWRVAERATLTLGVRADLLDISGHAPYNTEVDSIFGRRTDEMPIARIHVSPRFGFSWDVSGTGRDRLRGGAGLFTGRPPPAWLVPGLASYGIGIGVLSCGRRITDAAPPPFEPDYRAAPIACATGPSLSTAPRGDVNLLDRQLRMAQSLRVSLAYDRQLSWGFLTTTEVLVSRHTSDFSFVNLNLEGPQEVDRFGRTLYGSIGVSGVAVPALRSEFSEVIDLRNTSKHYSYQLSTRMEKRFTHGIAAIASYTFSRVRDVQSPSRVNAPGIQIWGDARALSGRHDEAARGISLNDIPHRAVAAITYRAPWRRAPTDLSLYYVGESGSPFTYIAGGFDRRGDLNADGSNINDPIYVARDVFDPNEVLFSGNPPEVRTQQEAFANFVERSSCLRRQRGRIVGRNSCREPWSNTTIASLRQAVPIGGRDMETGFDVFNVLNLLNRRWGRYRVAETQLLEHVGQTSGPVGTTQPIFRFNTTRNQWTTLAAESAFLLQLNVRYRF